MSKISSVMDIAKRSMMNSQNALQTVSHNVASKNVEGYSRQRVEIETTPTVHEGGIQLGTGSRTKTVTRVVNEYIEKQLQNEGGKLGTREGEAENLAKVENLFNDQLKKGLNQFVTEFFNAFRELANSPDSEATRQLVGQTAESVVQNIHSMNAQLKDVQEDVNQQVKAEVTQINSLISAIAEMNEKIESIEFTKTPANDERDRRDSLLKELGQKINIHYTEGENGKIVVTAGNTAVLVSGGEHGILEVYNTPEYKEKNSGAADIFFRYEHTTPVAITEQITGGKVGGAINIRDKTVNELRGKLDLLAYTIAEKVNMAHQRGFDRYGNTNVAFFDMPDDVKDASAQIRLNESIAEDPWKIAAAGMPDAPGDNRIANLVGSLQNEKWMDNGNSTFNDFYNGIVSDMAVRIRKANDLHEYQQNIVEQLKNVRENISGVNLDEEMVKMIEYQKAFDASARLIRAADEMLETVLTIKR